jgi:hypothetical protein
MLSVDTNSLFGIIPLDIKKLDTVDTITSYSNYFSGSLLPKIDNYTSLRNISFNTLGLHGDISSKIGNLKNIMKMSLYNNHLTSTIPSSIDNCNNLETIIVYSNSLDSRILGEIS